jgi:hypothetical protein
MSKSASVPSSRVEQAVLIVFADLTRFMVNSRSTPDATLAELLDGYYRHAEGLVSAAGGRIVKFMGDAFLAVWPEARAGDGVEALSVLKRAVDAWWAAKGWDSRLILKAHFGRAVIGPFGTDARFDVSGTRSMWRRRFRRGRCRCTRRRSGASRTESARRSGSTRHRWCTSRWTIRGLDRGMTSRQGIRTNTKG